MDCEIESHINHQTEIFNDKKITQLIKEKKKYLEKEKSRNNMLKGVVDDCMKTLNQYFMNILDCKEKEISIKEEMIKEFELYKYDKDIKENIIKLKFENEVNFLYNENESWDVKLNNLFEYFNEPIQIKRNNLYLKENFKGPFYLDKTQELNDLNIKDEENEKITDLCPLHKYMNINYFAVSYNNGLLKIYDDQFNGRPKKIIKEFEKAEGINSLYKCSGHSILLIGHTTIKKIYLSEDLNDYRIISQININTQSFKTALEIESFNCLITNNRINELNIYDFKNGNQLLEIKYKEENEFGKEISFMDKISENKIIVKINDEQIMFKRNGLEDTLVDITNINVNNDNNNSSMSNSIFTSKDIANSYWEIFEWEKSDNNINVKKNHIFDKKISYLTSINNQYLLLHDKNEKQLILFDITSYYDIISIKFKYQKPIIAFSLKRRTELLDLLCICEGQYFIQCTLNLNLGLLYTVAKIEFEKCLIKRKAFNLISINDNIAIEREHDMNKINDSIIKTVNLSKNNIIFMIRDYSIYNLKHWNK